MSKKRCSKPMLAGRKLGSQTRRPLSCLSTPKYASRTQGFALPEIAPILAGALRDSRCTCAGPGSAAAPPLSEWLLMRHASPR